MFVLPAVFSWPVVTKGCFPLVTVELTQARADPAPAREARETWQGPAIDQEGSLPLGCWLLPAPRPCRSPPAI